MTQPLIARFGAWVRANLQNESAVGIVGGLVFSILLIPWLLAPLLPVLWFDRRYGARCQACNRSVTLRCRHDQVSKTGKCCHCHHRLFDPQPELH